MENINVVVIEGNLTRDPELRSTPSGTSVCTLRVACNGRRKSQHTGDWEDDPNYFDVTVWGAQAENCNRFLSKGSGIMVNGRLNWREYEHQGVKRQAVDIVADRVRFTGPRNSDGGGSGGFQSRSDVPSEGGFGTPATGGGFGTPSAAPAGAGSYAGPPAADDDIPF